MNMNEVYAKHMSCHDYEGVSHTPLSTVLPFW